MYSIKNKSFAEKSKDKTEFIRKYGKKALLIYSEIEEKKQLTSEDLYSIISKHGLQPDEVISYLLEKNIIEKKEIIEEPVQIQQEEPQEASEEPIEKSPVIETKPIEIRKSFNNPTEQLIYDNFGDAGLEVYRAYSPNKALYEIAKQSNQPTSFVLSVIDFMKSNGIIQPEQKFSSKSVESIDASENLETEVYAIKLEKEDYKIKMIIPLELALKYGEKAKIFLNILRSKKDIDLISLIKSTRIPLKIINEIVDYLNKKAPQNISIKKFTRKDIRQLFGYDSYAVYKKHGLEGLIFFSLIGEDDSIESTIKSFIKITEIKDIDKIVEYLSTSYMVLNIKVPIDKSLIERYLKDIV